MPGAGWSWGLGVMVAAGLSGTARAGDLFACREIVSGTEMRMHPEAMERCVRDVVVRLTGRASVREDARLGAIVAAAGSMVEDLVYLDRMSDMAHHDEQGTRERPYDLIVHFDPERMSASLRAQGLVVWRQRPALVLEVSVAGRGDRFRLDADGDAGERQRRAALAAGERFGMRVVLPTRAEVERGAVPAVTGAVRREGRVVWSEADFGWNADWALGDARWQVRGVSFDECYRVGVGGVAERLAPKD